MNLYLMVGNHHKYNKSKTIIWVASLGMTLAHVPIQEFKLGTPNIDKMAFRSDHNHHRSTWCVVRIVRYNYSSSALVSQDK